jgi:WD40 repeat protein
MSNLFISHSSRDTEAAQELKDLLAEQGHRSVFLDMDPEAGIQAGVSWERTLYTKLRACRAVIALCSDHYLASQWCFAEIALARMEGKDLFVLQINPWRDKTNLPSILTEEQFIDLRTSKQQGYQRLWNGFRVKGIVAAEAREWSPDASPYPGLRAFGEEDAAIFFGRDLEIREGVELLNRVRRQGYPHLVMVLGSSGSGKSSLVRAGLVPQLRKEPSQWHVVRPFRPGRQPSIALAASLSHAFEKVGQSIPWEELHRNLEAAMGADLDEAIPTESPPGAAEPDGGNLLATESLLQALSAMEAELTASDADEQVSDSVQRLKDYLIRRRASSTEPSPGTEEDGVAASLPAILTRLRLHSQNPEAKLVLVIDQFEELLGHESDHPATSFLTMLRLALEAEDGQLLLIATMRSDYLGLLQRSPPLRGVGFRSLSVGPMGRAGMRQIIEEPAQLGQIQLENGLADLLLQDTETADALPLLAFTLRLLWDRHHELRRFEMASYEQLGRLQGAIAQVADETYEAVLARVPEGEARDVLARQLRDAFLSLARPAAEGSGWSRQTVRWQQFSETVQTALLPFVDAQRLLVRRANNTVEVAHEALFRSWTRLKGWLDENAEGLHLLREIRVEAGKWSQAGTEEEKEPYLFRGGRLARARELEADGVLALEDLDHAFLAASLRAETAQAEAEAARQRRELRRARIFAANVAAAFLVAVGLAFYANREKVKAQDQTLVAIASNWLLRDPTLAALVLTELRRPQDSDQAVPLLGKVVRDPLATRELAGHADSITEAVFSPQGDRILTASADHTVRIWTKDGAPITKGPEGEPLRLIGHTDVVTSVAIRRQGDLLATASADDTVRLWTASGEPLRSRDGSHRIVMLRHDKRVNSVAFSPDGERLVSGSEDGTARLWRADGTPLLGADGRQRVLNHGGGKVSAVAYGPRGDRIATGTYDGTLWIWSLPGAGQPLRLRGHSEPVSSVAFDAAGERIVTASLDNTVRVWHRDGTPVQGRDGRPVLLNHPADVFRAAFNARGDQIVTACKDGAARLWKVDGTPVPLPASNQPLEFRHHAEVNAASFSPAGDVVLTASKDGTARLWRPEENGDAEPSILPLIGVLDAVFMPTGPGMITAVIDDDNDRIGTVYLIASTNPRRRVTLQGHRNRVTAIAFSSDRARIVTGSDDGTARLWDLQGGALTRADGRDLVLDHGSAKVTSVGISPGGEQIVTGSDDGLVRLWKADGKGGPLLMKGHSNQVTSSTFNSAGDQIVTTSKDRTARIWHSDGRAMLMQWAGSPVVLKHPNAVNDASFSPRGERIVTASEDKIVRVWKTDGSQQPQALRGHQSPVMAVAFSPSGAQIVSGSEDSTARVWRADGRGEPLVLLHQNFVANVGFDRSGSHVVSTSQLQDARVWRITYESLRARILAHSKVCLTPEFRTNVLGISATEARRIYSSCQKKSE